MGVFLLDSLKFYYDCDEAGAVPRVDQGPSGLTMGDPPGPDTMPLATTGILNNSVDASGNPAVYLHAAHNDLFRFAGNATIAGWCRPQNLTVNHWIMSHWDQPANQRGWILYGRNATDRFAFDVSNDGLTSARAEWGSSYSVGTWFHVRGEVDVGANEVRISVNNGTPVTTAFTGPIFAATSAAYITAANVSSFLVGLGDVDELGAWDRLLNTEEKAALFGSGTPPSFSTFEASGGNTGAAAFYYFKRS